MSALYRTKNDVWKLFEKSVRHEVEDMKAFDVKARIGDSGEYILGVEDTGSHACYLIYGIMKPHEKGRELKPGEGHEELLLATRGNFMVTGRTEAMLKEGQAIHLRGDETCWLENTSGSEARYVIAGGHSESGHH